MSLGEWNKEELLKLINTHNQTQGSLEELSIPQDHITPDTRKGGGRTYTIILDDSVVTVPSVTTTLDILSKPALVPWAYNVGVEETLKLVQEEGMMPLDVVKQRLKDLERTHNDRKNAGGDRGTFVHAAAFAIFTDDESIMPDVPEQYMGYIEQLHRFAASYAPEVEAMEFKVVSLEHEYAGQADIVCKIGAHPSGRKHPSLIGKRILLDIKSNKEGRVYPTVHIPQVEGYAHAYEEMGGLPLDARMVLGVGEGSFQPCVSYGDIDTYLPILDAYNALEKLKQANPNGRTR